MICKICNELVLVVEHHKPGQPLDATAAVNFKAAGDAAVAHFVARHQAEPDFAIAVSMGTMFAHSLLLRSGFDGIDEHALECVRRQLLYACLERLKGAADGCDNHTDRDSQ